MSYASAPHLVRLVPRVPLVAPLVRRSDPVKHEAALLAAACELPELWDAMMCDALPHMALAMAVLDTT